MKVLIGNKRNFEITTFSFLSVFCERNDLEPKFSENTSVQFCIFELKDGRHLSAKGIL